MAKKKKATATMAQEADRELPAPESGQQQRGGVGIRLAGIVLRSLSYRELEGHVIDPETIQSATNFNVGFTATGNFAVADTTTAQLTLSMSIRPDPAVRPLEIDVVMSAGFQRDESVSIRDFLSFISSTGGVIIFPYVRELVASITMRSPFGHVVLNPLRVGPILNAEGLEQLVQELEAATRAASKAVAAG